MTAQTDTEPRWLLTGAATLGVVAASIGFGMVPFFARSLSADGMAPHAVAFYRYILAATLLLPALRVRREQVPAIVWGIGAGLIMGVGWTGYVSALAKVPVSTAGVLYMTYPVFTLLIAWALFREKPSRRGIAAALMISVAAAISSSSASFEPALLVPLLLSLSAPIGFGFGINVLVHRLTAIPPLTRIGAVSLGSVLGLTPLMATSEAAAVIPADAPAWLMVAGIALVTAFVPQLIYTICAPLVGTARTAAAGAIELPTMFILGWVAFQERVGASQWLACAIVVAAIVLTPSKATRNVSTNIAVPKSGTTPV